MRNSRTMMVLFVIALVAGSGVTVAQGKSARRAAAPQAAPATPKTIARSDEETQKQFADSVNVALVVGVSDYPKSSGLTPLQYAANDADGIAFDLRKRGYLVETLTNADAMHQAVFSKINQLSHRLTKDQGTFVFFFSGHGFSQNDKAYLATFDTNKSDLTQGALAVKDVADALKKSGAMRQMMFLDACRDNAVLVEAGKAVAPPLPPLLAENDGLAVLWSTKAENFSYEDPGSKHGIYTNYLMQALEGKAARNDAITFRGVSDYVTQKVFDDARTKQLFQRPYIAGEASGDFLVASLKVTLDIAPPPPLPPPPTVPTKTVPGTGGTGPRAIWRGSDGHVYNVVVSPQKVDVFTGNQIVASADKVDKKTGKLSGNATRVLTPCPDLTQNLFLTQMKMDNFKVDSVSDTKIEMRIAKGFNTGKGYVCQGNLKPEFTNFTLLLETLPR